MHHRSPQRGRLGRDWVSLARPLALTAYIGVIGMCWFDDHAPCVFWTMLMPALPALVVVIGFHRWRRLCPLAQIGTAGAHLATGRRRRLRRLERFAFPLSFALLGLSLVVRLLATNGDPLGLGCLLAGLGMAAIATNWRFGGRAWCNYFCPVGVVERIYTDRPSATATSTSRCEPCVGCKATCPDIDQARAHRRDVQQRAPTLVWYAFPGLVVAFYGYFALRGGSWEAFFGGAWTTTRAGLTTLLAPGLTFAPQVPAVVAAPAILAFGAVASASVFSGLERGARNLGCDAARARAALLAVSAFCAFCAFYVFAGQPSLRNVPGARFLAPATAWALGAKILYRRLRPHSSSPSSAASRLPILQ